jgi:predicted nuclease with TOPRIM domain
MADMALGFEEIREMFRETDRLFKESDRKMQESREEIDRLFKETARQMEKTDKRIDKLSKQMGGLHRSPGELIETLIAPHLWEKFGGYPYNLCRGYQRVMVYNEKNKQVTEIDILLSDTEWSMAVEVKRELRKDDIDRNIVRMGRILRYPPAEIVGKKLLGAIAGGVVGPEIHDYVYKAGFFLLELKGDNVALVPPPAGFSPKIW